MQDEEYTAILAQIQQILDSGGTIASSQIREWAHLPSVQLRWLVTDLLLQRADRIPDLSGREKNRIVLDHLVHEMRVRHDDSALPGPFLAGHSLRAWFERLWSDRPGNEEVLSELRRSLASLAVTGGPEARNVVITAVLEHLFGNPGIAAFFAPWRDDPQLAPIYEEASRLAKP